MKVFQALKVKTTLEMVIWLFAIDTSSHVYKCMLKHTNPASIFSSLRLLWNNYLLALNEGKKENHGFRIILAKSSNLKYIT